MIEAGNEGFPAEKTPKQGLCRNLFLALWKDHSFMRYMQLGPVKIPFKITGKGEIRNFEVAGLKIPYSTYIKNQHKYYRFGFLSFRVPNSEQVILDWNHSHYLAKDQLTQENLEKFAYEVFDRKHNYPLNLRDPKTFNEKIFWLKLNYHDPMITRCCDKFAVKDYINETIGPGYVIPTIASWDRAEDVDFSVLPAQYVLKVNWSSGFNIIVKDPSQADKADILRKISYWMEPEQNSYYQSFNWGYRDMKPVVYAEEYVEQIDDQLYDYKFFVFNGKVEMMFIATDRLGPNHLTFDFFTPDFQHLPITYGGAHHADPLPEKPKFFDEMIVLAEKLAKPFPFVRVDFYESGDKLYVGEMTFYSGGGMLAFDPPEWDRKLGDLIHLPEKK